MLQVKPIFKKLELTKNHLGNRKSDVFCQTQETHTGQPRMTHHPYVK